MPNFDTPQPITATVEISAGSMRLVASDRDDTVVDVRPRDESRSHDVKAAEQVRVDFKNGALAVTSQRGFSFPRRGAIVVDIALPSGSRLNASAVSANITADGRYADCKFASVSGDLEVGSVIGNLKADNVSGGVTVGDINGSASVSTVSGDVAIDGDLDGDVKFRAASGSITVTRLHGNLNAQSASGDVTVATAVNGGVAVQTASGEVVVGVAEGTAAQLDVRSRSGEVRNLLTPSDGPAAGDETLVVHARTGSGDIVVQRATADALS
jgi:Putative adhesin